MSHSYAPHSLPPTGTAGISREHGLSLKDPALQPSSMSASDFGALSGNPTATSPLGQSFQQTHGLASGIMADDLSDDRRSSIHQLESAGLRRSASTASVGSVPGRSNTLRKQKSISRKSSLKRSSSKRSVRAGSIGGITYDDTSKVDFNSVFYTPVPTSGSPTEILANRFQGKHDSLKAKHYSNCLIAWRKFLKDMISYFREIQASYESRAKTLSKVSNTIQSLSTPGIFSAEGGLADANNILRDYHKKTIAEATKAREIENDIVAQLSGLRSDLSQKIKEIKSLSGDFKNSVEKEKEGTRKAVNSLQEALAAVDSDNHAATGSHDPFLIKLNVDRQVERQIDEENYLHRVSPLAMFDPIKLTRSRHILTWKAPDESSSPLLLARSRRHTMRLRPYSERKQKSHLTLWKNFELGQSQCPKI
jgi:hypothetical protein